MFIEEWKFIQNFEDYMISNTGKVKSFKRGKEKPLIPDLSNQGYGRVTLSQNGILKRFQISRLVALHFIPNKENKPFVNHIDNNPLNNNVSNLEWCTHSENMIHAQKQNRLYEAQRKGGQLGSATNKTKAIEKALSHVGQVFQSFKVLEVFPFVKYQKLKVKVECILCNSTFIMSHTYIINNRNKRCINCRKKI